jgi:myo-inositol-1(or 4)-monophosphatase
MHDYPEIAHEMVHRIEKGISPLLGTEKACSVVDNKGVKTLLIDKVAEDAVITYIEDHDGYQLVTEETGIVGEGETTVILDPIDGTTNALLGIPFYAVSLAFWGKTSYGFVKNLCTQDVYEAFQNGAPLKNGKEISPACPESVASGYVGEGYQNVFPLVGGWRCLGSLALELSYVAEGKLTALVDLREKARIVDIAGAQIIAEAAGVKVTDEKGNLPFAHGFFDETFIRKKIICALPELHKKILDALQ